MTNGQKLGIAAGGVLCVAAYLGAQAIDPKNTSQFAYKEAADPKLVIESYHPVGNLNVGAGKKGEAAGKKEKGADGGNNGDGAGFPYEGNDPKTLGAIDPLFFAQEILGRPTGDSMTINLAAHKNLEVYCEYGTKAGSYTARTTPATHPGGEPFNVLIEKLKPNTEYFYRVRYKEPGAKEFSVRPEHSFHTARAAGSTFTFVAQFDPHLAAGNDLDAYKLTLKKMLADKPDMMFDLGDNFQSDRMRPPTKTGVEARVQLLRSYYDLINHSVPLYMVMGNHEGEWGRNLNGTPENVAIYDTLARKRYIPNPEANGFYTGGGKPEPLVGLRQAYYAFEWGDALFVALDPYWYQPQGAEAKGDWQTTLGKEQYDWLKKTLESSHATYKFIFSHNLIGGLDMKGSMRGGIETVKYTEMGGYNYDGTWGWDKARPGWATPLHPLMVANNATIWFHGHDHLYAKQDLDGMVYQEGPMPAREGKFDASPTAKTYNYLHGTVLGGSGYIRVRVSPGDVKVDYVQTYLPREEDATHKDGMIADTYTIKARKTNPAVAAR